MKRSVGLRKKFPAAHIVSAKLGPEVTLLAGTGVGSQQSADAPCGCEQSKV